MEGEGGKISNSKQKDSRSRRGCALSGKEVWRFNWGWGWGAGPKYLKFKHWLKLKNKIPSYLIQVWNAWFSEYYSAGRTYHMISFVHTLCFLIMFGYQIEKSTYNYALSLSLFQYHHPKLLFASTGMKDPSYCHCFMRLLKSGLFMESCLILRGKLVSGSFIVPLIFVTD